MMTEKTISERLEQEIKDNESLVKLLIKERQRFEFLHSNNKDTDGWEWGVARVRINDNGLVEYLWGNSDHSDIDNIIGITC